MHATIKKTVLPILQAKVSDLNNRAKRYNFPVLSVTIVSEFEVSDDDTGIPVEWVLVDIDGLNPVINGWRLIAKIENDDTIGTIVKIAPGVDDDGSFAQYRDSDYSCDHCNTSRNRKSVFVLQNVENGSRKVIGRNCLADYIRSTNAEGLADWAEMLSEFDFTGMSDSEVSDRFEDWGAGRVEPSMSILHCLRVASVCIRKLGWVSRANARDDYTISATADNVALVVWGRGQHRKDFIARNDLHYTDADEDLAEKAIEWILSVDSSQSEYLETCKRIAQAGTVTQNTIGYAASIVSSYRREEARRAEAAGRPDKFHFGEEKQRVRNVPVRVVGVHYHDSFYGIKTIVRMESAVEGGIAPIVWFASGEKDYNVGSDYTMTATIKEHSDHPKFGVQTVVQRAQLAPVE